MGFGVGLAAILILTPMVRQGLAANSPNDLPRLVQDEFRPNQAQWKSTVLAPSALRRFPGLVTAEATVGLDDDIATPVYSPFSGQVLSISVHAGDHVEKGETLMTVAATEAVQAQSDLASAAGTLKSATIAARNGDENEKRQHALYDDGSAALKDWQQAQADQAAAAAALNTAQATYGAAADKLVALGFSARQIAAMETRRPGGQAPAAPVSAPLSGLVIQRQVGPGQFLQAGNATAAFTIGDLRWLWLVGNVREEDAPQIRVGQQVEISVAALPARLFQATLTWVASSIDQSTHRLSVRAEIANPGGVLKPGMFATMTIHVGDDRTSPAVPESAIIREGDGAHVWVSPRTGVLTLRSVRTGRDQNGYVELLNGLAAGESVAIGGGLFLDDKPQSN